MPTSPIIWSFVVSILLSGALWFRNRSHKRSKLPPGPPGLPFIGNILDVPTIQPWKAYAKLAEEYDSPILSMRLPGTTLLILNDMSTATDLLTKRAAKYSDRPQSSLSDEMGASRAFVFQRYGEHWKQRRKIFKHSFDNEALSTRRIHTVNSVRRLLARLLATEGRHHEKELRLSANLHIEVLGVHMAVGEVVMLVTYGIQPTGPDDAYNTITGKVITTLTDILNRGLIVDAFPPLKYLPGWFPGTISKYQVEKGAKLLDKAIRSPFEQAQARMVNGDAIVPSICSRYFSSLADRTDLEDQQEVDDMANVLGTAYIGGMDTTLGVLEVFVIAMLLYPNVQIKAQTILDSALHGRLPEYTDHGTVPYIDALLDEVVRWMPVAPMATPHALIEDDVYNGYVLPKGATCIANVWAILQDEEIFGADTNKLIPERFLDADGCLLTEKEESVDVIFGFGRRSCPGKSMAREFLWIAIASILSAYEICGGEDEEGRLLVGDRLESSRVEGLLMVPPHVRCKFKLRKEISIDVTTMIHESIKV
ncbi:hypothetical protein VNI00_003827 [Paramarasmius palmivorus]|uniref:Cytochrome P450 n=1 Tax=Paramarasmius palmivorus TaxID=297713 RepID=A0AAW0DRL5_9AGAR